MGSLRHRVGEPRRRAQEIGEEEAKPVVRLQDGEELHCGRHASEGPVQGGERAVRIGRAAESCKQSRDQLGQDLRARLLWIAGRRPKCQPRTVSATASGFPNPRRRKVDNVSGSSAVPVKTRLPTSEASSGPSSNSNA